MTWRHDVAVITTASVLWIGVGGSLTAVTIRGSSMEPGIVAGDVVIVRHDPPYGVGDVVAHRATPDGSLVLHRVVATEGPRLVLRGDANHHDDDVRPLPADVVGRQVVRIARGERLLRHSPAVVASGSLVVLVARGLTRRRVHRSRRRRRSGP